METPNTNAETFSKPTDVVAEAARSQNDSSITNAKVNRKNFMDALEKGTLACLPGPDGKADVSDVKNVVNGSKYKGMTTLILKNFSKLNGYPTNEFTTVQQLEKVNMEKQLKWEDRLKIRKGEHGVNIEFLVPKHDENGNEIKDPETGKTVSEKVTAKLFNVAQVENNQHLTEWTKARYEYAKLKAGDKWHEPNPNKVRDVVNASSSDPAQYLAEYFDAMEKGKDFAVTKEIAEQFKEKTKEYIWERKAGEEIRPHVNPYRLSMLAFEAGKKLSDMNKQTAVKAIRENYAKKSYEEKLKNHQAKKSKYRSMSDDDGMSM